MITFEEIIKDVHLLKDLILSDLMSGVADHKKDEEIRFSNRLLAMKKWFSRVSCPNKKRFLLALLENVQSAWTLSCLLKSIWNCRLKDAVMSSYEKIPWSMYDQMPMDHNRTAIPVTVLAQVMKSDRSWFLSLEPQSQTTVLLELLSVSGGPVMMAVHARAQKLYDKYQKDRLQNLQDCIVLGSLRDHSPSASVNKSKATSQSFRKPSANQLQKELDFNLTIWNTTMKAMRDSLKMEELEMTFKDGTKRKIWKVNRPKPESIETVGLIQLLPSEVAKRILSFLPLEQLSDIARVNRYFAYLVEDYRLELATQQKLDTDLMKLKKMMSCHESSLEGSDPTAHRVMSQAIASTEQSMKYRTAPINSTKVSEKSTGVYSFRHFMFSEKLAKPIVALRPLRNLAELSNRLEQRGAVDDNLWQWCHNVLANRKYRKTKRKVRDVLPQDNLHFPSSNMKETLDVPLFPPLLINPATESKIKPKKNISIATVIAAPKKTGNKRFSLWSKDLSSLYRVYKIPSHAFVQIA